MARLLLGPILLLLINGWIDFANYSLLPYSHSQTGQSVEFDDYDTMYEWVAEEIFEIEEAQPEQEGETDYTGKINPYKVTLDEYTAEYKIRRFNGSVSLVSYIAHNQLSKGYGGQWVPPPIV